MVDKHKAVAETLGADAIDKGLRRQLIGAFAVFSGLTSPIFAATNWTNPYGLPVIVGGLLCALWSWSVLLQLKWGVPQRACAVQLLVALVLCLSVASFCSGGVSSTATVWIAVAPALGLTMDGRKVAAGVGILATAFLVVLGLMTWAGWVYPMMYSEDVATVQFTLNTVFMTILLLLLVRVGEQMNSASKRALRHSNDVLSREVTEHEETRERLNRTHRELVASAHVAGAAQVATGILHNLGNALNAVQVSTGLAESRLTSMRLGQLGALADLIEPQVEDKVNQYSRLLVTDLESSRAELRDELRGIRDAVAHAVAIVETQQRHAVRTSVTERVEVSEVLGDALSLCWRVDSSVFVDVRCDDLPMVILDRHRVLQIITNLISNAFDACKGVNDAMVQVKAYAGANDALVISVTDNGVGISEGDLEHIFSHGFTTRAEGHGFGLHASAIAAQELGGALSTHSDGLGLGAQFTLTIPSPWAGAAHAVAAGGRP